MWNCRSHANCFLYKIYDPLSLMLAVWLDGCRWKKTGGEVGRYPNKQFVRPFKF